MKSQLSCDISISQLESIEAKMLPPEAQKKMQCWIRSRHLICSGNFFVFETVDYSAVDRFGDCVTALGGSVITVEPTSKIWMGDHRQVVLYQAKASLHTPCHNLKQYWLKYGSFRTRFDPQV
ncbi:MAG: CpeR family transcriptional regulator [Oscillatoriophycideae cyanobacterium NC_groundwater_1537_Pr4_S-0.65um_50_18]|nr:CpeR family transcriptional regulator [Oscillatoriophycideae cyanobacterium NC_groundwater_1537_Pr4_S-0.65um_50_18]